MLNFYTILLYYGKQREALLNKYFKSEYWLGPITFLTAMWLINIVFGLLSLSPINELQSKDAQSAFIMPLVTAIAWWGISVITAYSEESLAIVITHGHGQHLARVKNWLHQFLHVKTKKILPLIVIGTLPIVSFYGLQNQIFSTNYGLNTRSILFIQAWLTWISFFLLLYVIYLGQRLISMHLHKKLRIRLFEIEQFSPICSLTIVNFVIPCLIVTFTAASAIFNPYSDYDLFVSLFGLIVTLCFLIYPMLTIRRVLGVRREQSLERINKVLNVQIESEDITDNRRLVDDFERLQFVSDLLSVRKEINSISLWPMDLPFAAKMAMVAMIPVLSWVGAGIVSQLLKVVN